MFFNKQSANEEVLIENNQNTYSHILILTIWSILLKLAVRRPFYSL